MLPRNLHIVETALNNGTNIILTVTNSMNVANRANFFFRCPVTVKDNVAGAPLPVFININGVATVPLLNRDAEQIKSARVPRRAFGRYIETSDSTTTTAPYVILYDAE